MPLLPPLRRWLVLFVLAVLLIPSAGMLLIRAQDVSPTEKRVLASAPGWPSDLADWVATPRRVDAYLRDHFAFRSALTTTEARLKWRLGGQLAGGRVVRGRGDWLVMTDELLHVTGGDVRADQADDYADFVCDLNRRLRARSIRLAASLAPSPAAIYPEMLPDWTPRGRLSEYDLVTERATACGVAWADLRPALRAAKPGGSIYFHHDTHWTAKGALIGFDQIVRALGRPEWAILPNSLTWRRVPAERSDLVALSGLTGLKGEMIAEPNIATLSAGPVHLPLGGIHDSTTQPAFSESTGQRGPTVLFIGDSYSRDFMGPYFAPHIGRFVWIHAQWCGFDWRVFDLVRPDDVVLMPVDRAALCRRGQRPLGMPPR